MYRRVALKTKYNNQKRRMGAVAHINHRTMFYYISMCIWLILPAQSMAKSLKNSIWYASKILNGTRYAEQNWEVRGTPWGEGVIASRITSMLCWIQCYAKLVDNEFWAILVMSDSTRLLRHVNC